jgi:hypothetical protein
MPSLLSPLTTYSDVTPQKRIITDVISLIDPSDAPMINNLGGLDGASGKFEFVNKPGKVVEWLEDTLIGLTGNLSVSTTATVVSLTLSDAANFQEGDVILIDSEYMWISAQNAAASTCTVTRGFNGSTTVSHAASAGVTKVGQARLEGAESDDIAFSDRTTGSNFSEILQQEVKVSRTQQQITQYGISDEMAYQGNKVVPSLMRLLERIFYHSTLAASGSATVPRVMAGYQGFVTTNKVSGATLAQSQFETAIGSAYAMGGYGPWDAYLAPANLQKVKNFYDSSAFLKVSRDENTVGMQIERVLTPYGEVNLVLDRWAKTTEIPLIDPKHCGWLTIYPFTQEPLAKTGDYDRSEVVGEFTLCLRQNAAHAVLTNVS